LKNIEDISEEEIENFYKNIGKNVKRMREVRGMTQLELSLAMNLKSSGLISQGELYHKKQHFNLKHLYQIAYILECDIGELFKY